MVDYNLDSLSDKQIVEAILGRHPYVTKEFLYRRCYPLFKAIYDHYFTDCESCFEFINEIYLLLMKPRKKGAPPRLATFGFRCSLTMWLKIVTLNYCRQIYAKKSEISEFALEAGDRNSYLSQSLSLNIQNLDRHDIERMLEAMPNSRYRELIRIRYVEDKTNEQAAALLGMSLPNFYNKHRLAKAQFSEQLRKEGLIDK